MTTSPGAARASLAAPALAGAAAAACLALVAGSVAGHARGSGRGTVGLDAWAQGATVDLLIAVSGRYGTELRHRRSRDGGASWAEERSVPTGPLGIAPVHRGSDPQIAAAGDRLVAVWTAPGSSRWGTGTLAAASSADGGATWSPAPGPPDDGRTDGHGYVDLATDAAGRFHAVWLDGRDGSGQGLRGARSDDGGRSWSANRTLDERTCECCWNRLLADGDKLFALYRDRDPRDLALAASVDAGTTWRRAGPAGAFDWRLEACPHVGGGLAATGAADRRRLHALSWTGAEGMAGLYVLASEDGGATWAAPVRLPSGRGQRGDLASSGDRLIAVWEEPAGAGTAVFAAESDGLGRTWSPPARLSGEGVKATQPIAVGTDRGVLTLWTELAAQGRPAEVKWRLAEPK